VAQQYERVGGAAGRGRSGHGDQPARNEIAACPNPWLCWRLGAIGTGEASTWAGFAEH
jgi:hypothetical protein